MHGDPKKKQKAVKKLVELRNRLRFELQKEEEKHPQTLELAKWYYGIWDGKIPEGNFGRVVKTFKELLEAFKLSEEEIKALYTWWLNLDKNEVPKRFWRIYGIVRGEKETRSITDDFKGKLRYIKGLKKELEGSATVELSNGEKPTTMNSISFSLETRREGYESSSLPRNGQKNLPRCLNLQIVLNEVFVNVK